MGGSIDRGGLGAGRAEIGGWVVERWRGMQGWIFVLRGCRIVCEYFYMRVVGVTEDYKATGGERTEVEEGSGETVIKSVMFLAVNQSHIENNATGRLVEVKRKTRT